MYNSVLLWDKLKKIMLVSNPPHSAPMKMSAEDISDKMR